MSNIERILAAYESGATTRRERLAALSRLISEDSVDSILSSVPDSIAQELLDWARSTPTEGGVVIGGELSPSAARTISEEQRTAVLAIRSWQQRRGRNGSGSSGQVTEGAGRNLNGEQKGPDPV